MDDRRSSGRGDPMPEQELPQAYDAAVRDPQTGVYVRPYFDESLRREFAFSARHGTLLSVVLLQLDALERLRSEWGSKAVETVLAGVAIRIRTAVRAEDVIARWEEGTFSLLLRDADSGTATIVAERLRRTVASAKSAFEDFPVRATASAGLATTHLDGATRPSDLMSTALANLQRAREAGGDCVVPGL